ncbi:GTPase Era, partial [Coxiella endosymbiont of Ornithodoros amblus]|uniref:GTPase Era n=1 Tax=Coxiella endosymbiont of Ornithodoros amblus TaxID=1656166 RepID=UPI00244D9FDF
MKPKYCGYAAIIGRPNVGKSTLLNQLLGQKISITSRKPQTTRYQILGVKTFKDTQVIYIDTPGLHADTERTINRYMNRSARGTLRNVDAIVFVIEPNWESQDTWVLDNLKEIETPVFLVINKVDKIKNRTELLPLIEKVVSLYAFQKIIPLSAKTGDQVGTLQQEVHQLMPESPFYFPPEQVTDRSDQFMASEIIREKLMRLLGQEIP